MKTKKCFKCKKEKPISEFYKDKYAKSGYQSYCKECHLEYHYANLEKNKENNRKTAAEWYKKNREKKLEYLKKNREKKKAELNND